MSESAGEGLTVPRAGGYLLALPDFAAAVVDGRAVAERDSPRRAQRTQRTDGKKKHNGNSKTTRKEQRRSPSSAASLCFFSAISAFSAVSCSVRFSQETKR